MQIPPPLTAARAAKRAAPQHNARASFDSFSAAPRPDPDTILFASRWG